MIKKTTAPGASDAAEKAVTGKRSGGPGRVKAEEPAKPKRSRKTKAEAEAQPSAAASPPQRRRPRKRPRPAGALPKKAEGPKKPTALIIMDGFGHRAEKKGNAIELQTSRISTGSSLKIR